MQRRSPGLSPSSLAMTSVVAVAAAGLSASSAAADPDDTQIASARRGAADPRPASVDGDKAPSSGLARTPAGLKKITSAKQIPVMIKYDVRRLASYTGTVQGLRRDQPSGDREAAAHGERRRGPYLGLPEGRDGAITADVRPRSVPAAEITRSFRVVYGGVAAIVPGNSVREHPDGARRRRGPADALNQPLTDSSTDFINAHRGLQPRSAAARTPARACSSATWTAACGPSTPRSPTRATCRAYRRPTARSRLRLRRQPADPGATTRSPATTSSSAAPRSSTPTTPVAGGEIVPGLRPRLRTATARTRPPPRPATSSTTAQILGVDAGPINGVAPGARVMEYKVCGAAGCFSSDSSAAVGQAILDGVDVINFSISGGTDPFTDPVELAFLDAYDAGVFVAASAGNDGPGAATTNHRRPWVTTVAASTQTREFAIHLTLTADGGDTFEVDGAIDHRRRAVRCRSCSAAAAPYSDAAVRRAGSRRHLHRQDRRLRARHQRPRRQGLQRPPGRRRGHDPLQPGPRRRGDRQPLAADRPPGRRHRPGRRSWPATPASPASSPPAPPRDGQGDVMAAFSSRGPAGLGHQARHHRPGRADPGGRDPDPGEPTEGPPGEYYQAIAGTSMSSPHVAGVGAAAQGAAPGLDAGPDQVRA